jgi:uncharacterized protein (TIGR04141 family)
MPKDLTHRLAIFLLKESLASPHDAVVKTNAQQETVSCGTVNATLYYTQANTHPPTWAKFFARDPVHAKLLALRVASNGAIMLVPAGAHWFALAWGTGRHMLVPGAYEENFGLRVTLNSLTSEQIRSIDHVSFDAYTLHQRAQSSRAGSCYDFRVDVDQNVVKALTGSPSDKTLAVRMTGVEALSASVQIDLAALPDLLIRYLDRYNSTEYQANFPWIDHLRPVLDQVQVDSLDAELVAKLQAGDLTRFWLAVPEILEQDDVENFSYRLAQSADHYPDPLLLNFLATVKDPSKIDVGLLKQRQVFGHRSSFPGHPRTWTVYRCLYCEIDKGTDTFLLYDAKWYRITRDFVQSINDHVKSFVVPSTLPAFDLGQYATEGAYNEAVAAAQPHLLLLDRHIIFHGGSSGQIEACDLFDLDRRLIHVKRHGSSATFSHLFNQGEVSARMLIQDRSFREKVIAKLSGQHQALIDVDAIKPSQFTIVFAVASDSSKPIGEALPFFSRMTFARVATMLTNYGYKVELMKIHVTDAPVGTAAAVTVPTALPTAVATVSSAAP